MTADLSVQSSIRDLARSLEATYRSLHVLVNAAGIILLDRRKTVDGIEMVLATDYLSHFLLTNLLLDLLKKSAPSRVVTVTGAPRFLRDARLRHGDPQLETRCNPVRTAVRAAAARLVFSREIARRLEGTGVTSNAFHPGLVRSNLWRHLPFYLRVPARLFQPMLKDTCDTGVYLASSSEAQAVIGRYFVNEKPVEPVPGGYTPMAGKALWAISERLTGLS